MGMLTTAPFRDMSVFTILEDGDLMTGQVVTYVVSVSNLGNVAAENVVLTGTLPLSTTYLSSQTETFFGAHAVDAFTPTVSNRQVVWTLGSVPGGGTGNLRIRARIDPGVPVGTNLSNTATVSTSSADAQPANNTSSVSGTVYAPDAYEPDDYFSQARPIASNGSRQHRSFHSAGDADWVWFTATVGLEYVISTSSLGSDANTYLYLYGADGVTVLVEDDDSGGGRASRIVWRAGQSEPFYVRVVNAGTEHGPGATYDLSVDGHPASPDLAVTKDPAGRLRGGSVAAYTIAVFQHRHAAGHGRGDDRPAAAGTDLLVRLRGRHAGRGRAVGHLESGDAAAGSRRLGHADGTRDRRAAHRSVDHQHRGDRHT